MNTEIIEIFNYLSEQKAIGFNRYNVEFLKKLLDNGITETKRQNYKDYSGNLMEKVTELAELISALTINHSFFSTR